MIQGASDYPFGIFQTFGPSITCPSLIYTLSLPLLVSSNFWPLYHLSLSDLHLFITPLESSSFWPLYHMSDDTRAKSLKIPKGVMRGCKSARDR
jgi:hypothetical protein